MAGEKPKAYAQTGHFLRQLREGKGLKLEAVAAEVKALLEAHARYQRRGGSASGLWRYEEGEQLPGPEVVWALSKIYGRPLHTMFGRVYGLPVTEPKHQASTLADEDQALLDDWRHITNPTLREPLRALIRALAESTSVHARRREPAEALSPSEGAREHRRRQLHEEVEGYRGGLDQSAREQPPDHPRTGTGGKKE